VPGCGPVRRGTRFAAVMMVPSRLRITSPATERGQIYVNHYHHHLPRRG
jgi:hypothetical protein